MPCLAKYCMSPIMLLMWGAARLVAPMLDAGCSAGGVLPCTAAEYCRRLHKGSHTQVSSGWMQPFSVSSARQTTATSV
jgi:hypothetical protein